MKSQLQAITLLLLTIILSLSIAACNPDDIENRQTLRRLYKTYKNGEITECIHEGRTVYAAGPNAFDAGGVVYDEDGNEIGTCSFAWGPLDSICRQLSGCEVIYRVEDNFWGQPAVDKYRLGF